MKNCLKILPILFVTVSFIGILAPTPSAADTETGTSSESETSSGTATRTSSGTRSRTRTSTVTEALTTSETDNFNETFKILQIYFIYDVDSNRVSLRLLGLDGNSLRGDESDYEITLHADKDSENIGLLHACETAAAVSKSGSWTFRLELRSSEESLQVTTRNSRTTLDANISDESFSYLECTNEGY